MFAAEEIPCRPATNQEWYQHPAQLRGMWQFRWSAQVWTRPARDLQHAVIEAQRPKDWSASLRPETAQIHGSERTSGRIHELHLA